MSLIVAVDIGGTQIRAAAYEPDSITPFAQKKTRTRASEPGVFDRLVDTIEAVWQPGKVDAIGIASSRSISIRTLERFWIPLISKNG